LAEIESNMDVRLVMFKEDGERKAFSVSGNKTIIGRKEDCDLRIPLGVVSREHCELEITDEGVVLRDLGSSNGTYVNNQRVIDEINVKPGDHVVVGPVVFTVQIDGKPEKLRRVRTRLHRKEGGALTAAAGAAQTEPPPPTLGEEPSAEGELDPLTALEALASDETSSGGSFHIEEEDVDEQA
jgi:pSer/pThr/pTyr-binding forkhead associated (FHA) protein